MKKQKKGKQPPEETIVFGGFYRHYKHDPKKGFNHALYQVINLGYNGDFPDQIQVQYRPLDPTAKVYREGKRNDWRNIEEWSKPVFIQRKKHIRYELITSKHEQWVCKKVIEKLYGAGEQSFFGTHEPVAELKENRADIVYAVQSTVKSARIILDLVREYPKGISRTDLMDAIIKLDTVIPIVNPNWGVTVENVIGTMSKGLEFKGMVETIVDGEDVRYRLIK